MYMYAEMDLIAITLVYINIRIISMNEAKHSKNGQSLDIL